MSPHITPKIDKFQMLFARRTESIGRPSPKFENLKINPEKHEGRSKRNEIAIRVDKSPIVFDIQIESTSV